MLADCPPHTGKIFDLDSYQILVPKMVAKLRALQEVCPFDAIAGMGHSGTPLIGALSYLMDIPMILVRKIDGETPRDYRTANGALACKRYLIIDDLISSGRSIERIIGHIKTNSDDFRCRVNLNYPNDLPQPVGVLLYQSFDVNYWLEIEEGKCIPVYDLYKESFELSTTKPVELPRVHEARAIKFFEERKRNQK